MKILVTGASGFIGSFIVEEGLRREMAVWAGMRPSSSKKYLGQDKLQYVELDFSHPDVLRKQLTDFKNKEGKWDYIVHAAGATKCLHKEDFFRTNYDGTRHFVEALVALDMIPERFVFISSLSVYGAIREAPCSFAVGKQNEMGWIYAPIQDTDIPAPNTAYGQSKLKAEQYLKSLPDFPYVILRPTGVYGPREKDYFLMAQSIQRHTDFSVGFRPQEITFVYVLDLVQAVFLSLEKPVTGKAYFISDGEVYNSRTFSDLIQAELGNPWVLHIKAPVWVLHGVCSVCEYVNKWLGKAGTLNNDKFHILRQRNWQCDLEPARKELGYQPQYSLKKGVQETIVWYKKEGWL